MQAKKPNSYTWLTMLALTLIVVAAILPLFAKADPPPGRCSYIGFWLDDQGGSAPCVPFYGCPNPNAWPMSDRCYAHWGVADAPSPCN